MENEKEDERIEKGEEDKKIEILLSQKRKVYLSKSTL